MNDALLCKAREFVDYLLAEHSVFSKHKEDISILITGSLAAGFADEQSDIDIWVLCNDEASACISKEFTENDLRFNTSPPNKTSFNETDVHYFAFPFSMFRQGLEMHDDMTLFYAAKCIICHDADSRFASLVEPYLDLPSDLLRNKVSDAYSWVLSFTYGLKTQLSRYQPVPLIENVGSLVFRTYNLCCWLDGKAPGSPKWIMHQAKSCKTADILSPVVKELMKELSPALESELPQSSDDSPLILAANKLENAARRALDVSGYADIPIPTLVLI